MARKSCIAGEYIIEQLDNGSISIYRVYENTKAGLREAAKHVGFKFNTEWTTRQLGSKLIDYVNEHKGGAAAAPAFCIDANATCRELMDKFREEFGAVLRVKNGNRLVPEEEVLANVGVQSADIEYNDDFTVDDFQKKVKDMTGLTVVVATADNWVAVIPEMPLNLAGNVPNNTTVDKMKAFLAENR